MSRLFAGCRGFARPPGSLRRNSSSISTPTKLQTLRYTPMVEVRAAMIELSAHGKLERERERIMRGGAVPDIAGYRCAPPLLAAWADWLQPVRDARKDGALWPWALRWAAPIMAVQRVVDAWQQGGRTGRVLWLTRATAA